jgi:hypothetical protein
MFDANDLRGQRIVLGMPPLAHSSGRNQCAPKNFGKNIIRQFIVTVKLK